MRTILVILIIAGSIGAVNAQTSVASFAFIDYQKSFPRISDALKRKQDTLMKQFREKGLEWPAKYLYIRSFKYDSNLEVWVKSEKNEQYKLFKNYRVCALAGTLGPKRLKGDYQVPEGFYYINEFKPNSNYHLALGLNYPNYSDRLLSDSIEPGGDIYIHGSCVTTGCIPVTNPQIEELYILAAWAKSQGQDFIPVHVFPINFSNQRSSTYLAKYLKDFPEYAPMVEELRHAHAYFDATKKLPLIMVDDKGGYIVDGEIPKSDKPEAKKKIIKERKVFNEELLPKLVDKLPVYPGGNEKFQAFIEKVSKEMAPYLLHDQQRAYIMLEFIIDENGKPGYSRVIKGGNEDLNEKLETFFDKMPDWNPAIRLDKNVPVKLKQSIIVEKL
ncbi:L,D-transpeptidase family protein [Flavitalea sp.]|nr:L,D-transpeptidase family protein [Flavitalea sp.]